MTLIYLILKVITVLFKNTPSLNIGDISKVFSFLDSVANIFAWAKLFLPYQLIFLLLSFITTAYAMRFVFAIAKLIISLFGGNLK